MAFGQRWNELARELDALISERDDLLDSLEAAREFLVRFSEQRGDEPPNQNEADKLVRLIDASLTRAKQ